MYLLGQIYFRVLSVIICTVLILIDNSSAKYPENINDTLGSIITLYFYIIIVPPILALYATPIPQYWLNAIAATSPAHLVPCLLSPLSRGIGSSSLSLMSVLALGSCTNKFTTF